jgi:hypothetical protein
MATVQNSMKDRCAVLRATGLPSKYEYGWAVRPRKGGAQVVFTKSWFGTLEEAQQWISTAGARTLTYNAKELAMRGNK